MYVCWGNLGTRGCAREKGKERLQRDHCFLHFFYAQILSVKKVIGQN